VATDINAKCATHFSTNPNDYGMNVLYFGTEINNVGISTYGYRQGVSLKNSNLLTQ
jgi:hypothetical protein